VSATVCFLVRRNGDGAAPLENLGVSVGSAIRGVERDGKIAQSSQPHAPDRWRRFYLAVRCSVGLRPRASPSDMRKHPTTCEIHRSGDLAATDRRLAALRSVDVRFARQTSANLLQALRSWKRWPTDCRTVAVSLQRVRSTSRADDRPLRLSAQLERRGTCRGPAVSEIELVPSGMLKLGASPSHYGLKNGSRTAAGPVLLRPSGHGFS
jgi:hypothetical protein